ncbi:MAG: tetratricopeptide repeat protein [Rhodovarius sp.]|nr:tetratricopeptide repeat protein [Rhodovarius sp.]
MLSAADHAAAGAKAWAAGDVSRALDHFRAAHDLAPEYLPYRLDLASALLDLGRLEEAEPHILHAAAIDATGVRVLYLRGRLAHARGDAQAALNCLEQAVAAAPDQPWPRVALGAALAALGRPEAAERAWREAEALAPGDAWLAAKLADLRARLRPAGRARPPLPPEAEARRKAAHAASYTGDGARAIAEMDAALALAPQHPELLYERGRLLLGLGRVEEAEQSFRAAEAAAPDLAPAILGLAQIDQRRGQREAAITRLQAALAAGNRDVRIALELGRCQREAGDLDAARAALALAREIDPRNCWPLIGLAEVAEKAGDVTEALRLLEEAAALGPDNPIPRIRRVELLLGQREERAAAAACAAALEQFPEDPHLNRLGARLALARGEIMAAAARLGRALAGGLRQPNLVVDVARALIEAGETEQALALAEAATPEARVRIARAARSAGQRGAAQSLLEQALAAAAGDRRVLLAAAPELAAQGRPEQAIELLEAALRGNDRDAELWLALGRARRAAAGGPSRGALEAFLRAAELDGAGAPPLLEAAREQRELGDPAAAERLLQRALAIAPEALGTLGAAVELLRQTGQDEEALAVAERIRTAHPEAIWALDHAVQILIRLGRPDDALALLKQAEAAPGAPGAALAARRARLLVSRGDPAAAKLLEEARQAWPDDPELWWAQLEHWVLHGAVAEASAALAAPPRFAGADPGRLAALRARLADAEWRLEAAAEHLEAALQAKPRDAALLERLARIRLLLAEPAAAQADLAARNAVLMPSWRARGYTPRGLSSLTGQLVNEYLLAPDLLAALRGLKGLPPAERIAPLRRLLREAPEHIAPALALLLALRQAGLLRSSPAEAPGGSPIPWRISQFWDDPLPPPDVEPLLRSWPNLNPGFAYVRFDRFSAVDYLRAHYPPEVWQAFHRAEHAAAKADLFRLAVLAREGGVYADADDRCVAALGSLLAPGVECVFYQEELASVANSFFAAVPGHPVLRAALDQAVAAVNRGDRSTPWLETGPGLLSRCFAAWLAEGTEEEMRARLSRCLVPSHFDIRRVVAIGCVAAYKSGPRNWQHPGRRAAAFRISPESRALLRLPEEAEAAPSRSAPGLRS